MIESVIIDDEKNNVDNLKGLLGKHCPKIKVVATAFNASDGIAAIVRHRPGLVFLDIQMPEVTGFQLLQEIEQRDFELIFVTAFDQFAIQAIRFSAIDYLLKPIKIDELIAAVEKAISNYDARIINRQLENLLNLLSHRQEKTGHRLALPTLKEIRFINPEDLIRCESANSYTRFYLVTGEVIIVTIPISDYEVLLKDYGFIRCHQSHLINKMKVKSWIKTEGGYLLMEDGTQIPVSRGKKDAVTDSIKTIRKNL